MVVILLVMTVGLIYLFSASEASGALNGAGQFLAVLWLIGFFIRGGEGRRWYYW